jgi:sugar O-acyltransferase (sialic acid O-acetyltransferase NeuD family)
MDVIRAEGRFEIAGIVENPGYSPETGHSKVSGCEVIGTDDNLPELISLYKNALITVGQIRNPVVRIRLFNRVLELGGELPVILSPTAYVSKTAKIGMGTIVMHQAMVNTEAEVGRNCILNSGCLIEHEAIVGDHCHISTHAILNGQCRVGSRTFIGSRTVMSNNTTVPDDTLISAGSVLLRSVEHPGTYIGNPLRKIR